MPQEITNSEQTKEKNTVALIGMICSIVGVLCLISIFGLLFGIIFLTIGFILGIIGLLYKPKTKARIAVIIPAIAGIATIIGLNYIKNSAPATEFSEWFKSIAENEIYGILLENDDFGDSVSNEFKEIIKTKSKNDFKELYNETSGSNAFERWSYVFFGLIKESIENSIEKYGLEPEALSTEEGLDEEEINEEEINEEEIDKEKINEEEINEEEADEEEINEEEINEEEIDKEKINEEETNKEEIIKEKEETGIKENNDKSDNKNKETKTKNVEIFNNGEKNDIEEIINILE